VVLGKPMLSEEDAKASYCVVGRGVSEAGELLYGAEAEAGQAYELGAPDTLGLDDLVRTDCATGAAVRRRARCDVWGNARARNVRFLSALLLQGPGTRGAHEESLLCGAHS